MYHFQTKRVKKIYTGYRYHVSNKCIITGKYLTVPYYQTFSPSLQGLDDNSKTGLLWPIISSLKSRADRFEAGPSVTPRREPRSPPHLFQSNPHAAHSFLLRNKSIENIISSCSNDSIRTEILP